MQLYCRCGYPIAVGGRWEGGTYRLALHDGVRGDSRDPARASITRCPQCGDWLQLAALAWQPPARSASVFGDPEAQPTQQ